MSHPVASASADQPLIYRHPGLVATAITILVAAIFLGALYRSATGGHGEAPAHAAPAAH